jgi:hypothetical protein
MGKYNLNEGNEALNRVLLMMKYDNKKTLTENKGVILLEQDSKSFEQGKTDVYPIPGYIAYTTPTPNTTKGGRSYMYFPDDANMVFWKLAVPENFPTNRIEEKKLGKKLGRPILTIEHLRKILPTGTVRQFKTKDGELFLGNIVSSEETNGLFVFGGYFSEKTNKPYVSPDPEKFKNWFEKQADKVSVWSQVIASIVVSIIVSYFTMGMGMSLAMRIFWEVMAEGVINAPFIYRDIKREDNWQAGLSIVFCLLPYMDAKLLSKIGPLGKFGQPEMTAAKELAEELATSTNQGMTVFDFYNSLPEDGVKRYLFSRVIQQSPELLEENVKIAVKQFLNDKTSKKALVKIMAKDKNWWKSAGMQFSTALVLAISVGLTTDTFNESEIKRLSNLINQAISEINKKGVKLSQDELIETARNEWTPEQKKEFMNLETVEYMTKAIGDMEKDPIKRAEILGVNQ